MRSSRSIDGDDALLLLDQVLRLVIDEEVVSHHLEFLTESILINFIIRRQPLVGHFVLDQHSLIRPDGPPRCLQSLVGVGMLQDPNSIEIILEHEGDLLQAGNLRIPIDRTRLRVQINRLIDQQRIQPDPHLLPKVDPAVLEPIVRVRSE